jgi:hypothetical protein
MQSHSSWGECTLLPVATAFTPLNELKDDGAEMEEGDKSSYDVLDARCSFLEVFLWGGGGGACGVHGITGVHRLTASLSLARALSRSLSLSFSCARSLSRSLFTARSPPQQAINGVYTDEDKRPYQDIRIRHTIVLEDPFPDMEGEASSS